MPGAPWHFTLLTQKIKTSRIEKKQKNIWIYFVQKQFLFFKWTNIYKKKGQWQVTTLLNTKNIYIIEKK